MCAARTAIECADRGGIGALPTLHGRPFPVTKQRGRAGVVWCRGAAYAVSDHAREAVRVCGWGDMSLLQGFDEPRIAIN